MVQMVLGDITWWILRVGKGLLEDLATLHFLVLPRLLVGPRRSAITPS